MLFELNGLGSGASSASCGFKTMTRDFPFPNYTPLLEQVHNAAPSHLARSAAGCTPRAQDGLAPGPSPPLSLLGRKPH